MKVARLLEILSKEDLQGEVMIYDDNTWKVDFSVVRFENGCKERVVQLMWIDPCGEYPSGEVDS